jgi:hypothetical protein
LAGNSHRPAGRGAGYSSCAPSERPKREGLEQFTNVRARPPSLDRRDRRAVLAAEKVHFKSDGRLLSRCYLKGCSCDAANTIPEGLAAALWASSCVRNRDHFTRKKKTCGVAPAPVTRVNVP